MFNCIVIDDEPMARQGLKDYITQIDLINCIGDFSSPLDALPLIKEKKVDIMFIDIEMPSINGLDFVASLENKPLVVFTTAYSNYAVKGFELDAADYLLKPITLDRFLKTVDKLVNRLNQNAASKQGKEGGKDYLIIKTDKKYVRLNYNDVLFIEGLKDYVKIHTGKERFLALVNLKNIESQLPQDIFIRVHRSYIVSMTKIKEVEGNMINMLDGQQISIGKEYKDAFFEKMINNKLIKR
jgi:two-component system LytT family response regulator